VNPTEANNMKNLILSSVFVLIASSAAQAQQAVQWKVSDGGNGHWYAGIPIDGGADWHTAQALALATGGALACLESVAEFNEIVPPIAANPQLWIQRGNWWRGPWIGGLQDASDPSFSEPAGGWRWISGDVISPDLLATIGNGNPNNFPCCEDRLQIGENYLEPFVNDVPASTSSLGMIVEWSADCNNDGIVDYGQILDGTFPDANGNGVPDCCDGVGSCTPCPGDVASDGMVDGVDLAAVLSQWGTQGSGTFNADIDGSGLVDGGDLALVLGGWGPCPQ
jgi:hypothetical protein